MNPTKIVAAMLCAAVLLFAVFSAPTPVHAQSVYLQVCNAGKVDIDVFVSRAGNVSSSHVGAADCATVAESAGAMGTAYVGLALVDSRGQWGAARRLDVLPVRGSGAWSRANQNVTVRHGNTNVSLPMQLLFRPPVPTCRDHQTSSAAANLPLNATAAQRNAAAVEDSNRPPGQTTCDTLGYTLNIEAYAESREITFRQECDPCDQKAEANLTPEERAARQRQAAAANEVIGKLSGLGPMGAVFGSAVQREKQAAEEERKARESRLSPTQRMDWSDLLPALRNITRSQKLWDVIPRNIVIRGTVSSVEVSKDTFEPNVQWVDVAFRESPTTDVGPNRRPYSEFNVCTSNPEIFEELFGADFLTSMIGKTVEIEGETQGAVCRGLRGSIRITLARQVRPVQSARFEPGTVPKFVPLTPEPPKLTPEQVEASRVRQQKEVDDANKYIQKIQEDSRKQAACAAQSDEFAKTHADPFERKKENCDCLKANGVKVPWCR
jgi:hypothetical protein